MKTAAVISLFLISIAARAQEIDIARPWWFPSLSVPFPLIDSVGLSTSQNQLFAAFDKTLSLYTWTSRLQYHTDTAAERFRSMILGTGTSRLRDETDTRVTDAAAHLKVIIPVHTGRTDAEVQLSGSRYQTNSGSANPFVGIDRLSRLTDGYVLAGVRHSFADKYGMFGGGGYAVRDNAYGGSSGAIVQGSMKALPLNIDDDNIFSGTLSLDERWYSLLDERYRNDNVSLMLTSAVGEDGENSARIIGGMLRRDFFFTGDSLQPLLKQERNETSFGIYDDLQYDIVPSRFRTAVSLGLAPRIITRRAPGVGIDRYGGSTLSTTIAPSETYQSDIRAGMTLSLLPVDRNFFSSIHAICDFSYREKTEDNKLLLSELPAVTVPTIKKLSDLLSATSYRSQETSLSLSASLPVSTNMMSAEFSAKLYRYDTPSTENVDDRDELYLHTLVSYRHSFTDRFSGDIGLRLSRYHLVYLGSQRSAQNNHIGAIALITRSEYRSYSVSHSLTAEINANYTEYDFITPNDMLAGKRDYIIRGLSLRDSAFIRYTLFSIPSGFELRADIRLYEQSSYNAANFSRRPQIELSEYAAEAMMHFAFGTVRRPVLIRLGGKGLFLVRQTAETLQTTSALRRSEELNRLGPAMTITLDNTGIRGFRLYGYGWYSFVTNDRPTENQLTHSYQIEARLAVEWTL